VDFYNKHHYPIHYVGNPTLDEVYNFINSYKESFNNFVERNKLSVKPIIALLAGSRKQEIKDNLPDMLKAVSIYTSDYQIVIAGAPNIPYEYYKKYIGGIDVHVVFGETYPLLRNSHAALVTSGTATLETALFNVPQVVCYHTPIGKVISFLKKHILKVRFISLVNLIADKEVVKELVADLMTIENMRGELNKLLELSSTERGGMLDNYKIVVSKLGEVGAPKRAAVIILDLLKRKK
jgi:lipid-A-disaccharide synthase